MNYVWETPKNIDAIVLWLSNAKDLGYSNELKKIKSTEYEFKLQYKELFWLYAPMYNYPYLSGVVKQVDNGCIIEAKENNSANRIMAILLFF